MMSKTQGPFLALNENDFDPTYYLDALPQCDFECPLCMCIKEDMLECATCLASGCRECVTGFTNKNQKGNVAQGKFECTICYKVT